MIDIGGGSLEVALGSDEEPTIAAAVNGWAGSIAARRGIQSSSCPRSTHSASSRPGWWITVPARRASAVEIMRALGINEIEVCPWALREGAILRWLDQYGRTRFGF